MTKKNDFKPIIQLGYKLQKNIDNDQYSLLYPEGLVELNETAVAILQLCDGQNTPEIITRLLEQRFPDSNIKDDINEFLEQAYKHGWIK